MAVASGLGKTSTGATAWHCYPDSGWKVCHHQALKVDTDGRLAGIVLGRTPFALMTSFSGLRTESK